MGRVLPILLAVGLCGWGCGREAPGPPGPPAAQPAAEEGLRRIVLVSVDNLRPDHLGYEGYPRHTSPFLDGLAARSVVFERVYAPSSWSLPANVSLLTSMLPSQHGVGEEEGSLAAELPTLAERFRQHGFATVAITAIRAPERSGLDRGFETVDTGPELALVPHRPVGELVDAAFSWLGSSRGRAPFFLWLRLSDPTPPYDPPGRYLDQVRFEPPEQSYLAFLRDRLGVPLGFFGNDPTSVLRLMNGYDGHLAAVDERLSSLYQVFESHGWNRDTLWVVTGSHGTGLGNHFWGRNGRLVYEEQVRVPLLIQAPGLAPRHVQQLVELVDVGPTLLELAGLPAPDPPVAGRSLVPLLHGEPLPQRAAFVERGTAPPVREERRGRRGRLRQLRGGRPPPDPQLLFALVGPRYKILLHESGATEVYDLQVDPHETHDLMQGEALPPEAEQLRAALEARVAKLEESGSGSAP